MVERNLDKKREEEKGERTFDFDLTEIITFVMHLDIKYTDNATRQS